MMFSAARSRRLQIVPVIQSFAQLERNYGKESAEIIIDNTRATRSWLKRSGTTLYINNKNSIGELIIQKMEWRGNALKRLPWYSDWQCKWKHWLSEARWSSAESSRKYGCAIYESRPEADGAAYRSGVYKIFMVRMFPKNWRTCECTGLNVDYVEKHRGGQPQLMWLSKNVCYEKPCCVIGTSKSAGL